MPKFGVLRTASAGEHWFVVLDGARYDDLPARLAANRLRGRSLVLDRADEAVIKAGPWLVDLRQAFDALERLITVADDISFVALRCESGESALFRHLRTLAVVKLPDDERVLFRYFDPQIMILMVENVEADQETALFGPAEEVLLYERRFARRGNRFIKTKRGV